MAAAFLNQQKALDRLQRRISAAERSLRASLETLARLRKQSQTLLPADEVAQPLPPANLDPPSPLQPVAPVPPATPSNQTSIPEIGFAPEILPAASREPREADPQVCAGPPGPAPQEGRF